VFSVAFRSIPCAFLLSAVANRFVQQKETKVTKEERALSGNPKGIVSSSPGLRGTSYPGCEGKMITTLKGLCQRPHANDTTLSGLEIILRVYPAQPRKSSGQPLD